MICLYLKVEQNVEEIFEKFKDQILPVYSISPPSWNFSKNFNGLEFRAQKSIEIVIQMLQEQRTTHIIFEVLKNIYIDGSVPD
jgi:hypothetical protein